MPDEFPGSPEPEPTSRHRHMRDERAHKSRRLKIGAAGVAVVVAATIGTGVAISGGEEPVASPSPTMQTSTAAPTPTPTPSPTPVKKLGPEYQQPGPPKGSPLKPVKPMQIDVSGSPVGTELKPGLVGLSLEATDLGDPRLSGSNKEIVSSLQGLGKPMLRFGGNAVDRRFFWTSSNEPLPGRLDGDDAHPVRAVGPEDLTRINTLLEAADATISLTVDLGHYDPQRAADMMGYASKTFGDRLVGFTVGNEPNGYPKTGLRPSDWGVNDYLTELEAYADAIHERAPKVPIVGPGTYSESWWAPFANAELPQKKILSFHHYPLSQCDGSKDAQGEPLIENLMDRTIHDRAQDYRKRAMVPAKDADLQTWIPETGVSACPGSNETTETHASALWSVDYALSAAQLGIPRLGFHSSLLTCTGGPPMSAICAGGPYLQPDATFDERANYFGLSLVSELQPGKFLKLEQSGGGLSFAYALKQKDGSVNVIVVNENNPAQHAQTKVTVKLPAKAATGTMTQLAGANYTVENESRIDGKEAPAIDPAKRPRIPNFQPGTDSVTLPVTAGTASVFHFTFGG